MLRIRRPPIAHAPERLLECLDIPGPLWSEILTELYARGRQTRESGAFLLAPREANGEEPGGLPTVAAAAYYDDLDAACLTGGITMSGAAYDLLWRRCP